VTNVINVTNVKIKAVADRKYNGIKQISHHQIRHQA
jgi:hypothetical protein